MQDIAALEEIGFVLVEKSISGSGSSWSGEFNSLISPTKFELLSIQIKLRKPKLHKIEANKIEARL